MVPICGSPLGTAHFLIVTAKVHFDFVLREQDHRGRADRRLLEGLQE